LGVQQNNKNHNTSSPSEGEPNPISSKKVMILAGGTGGHVMPALAVAQYLQEKNVAIHWLGTQAGFEARLVPQAGITISYIDIQGLRRTKWYAWALAPWRITKALLQSLRVMLRERPDVVLSMGGYVAGPGSVAAWLLRCPLVLHEQNAISGWTNRVLSKFAKRIMVAFPNVFSEVIQKVTFTGNPIRKEILALPSPDERFIEEEKIQEEVTCHLLILGGSQGAQILNQTVPQALALLPLKLRPKVWHQTGKSQLEQTKVNYAEHGIEAEVTDFIQDMAKAYAWADIVICRSGALTVAELSAVGVASILVPFPYAVDDHQTFNAKYLSDREGAFLLPQSALSAESLQKILLEYINNPAKRLAVAKACRQLAKPLATTDVAELCLEVSCGS